MNIVRVTASSEILRGLDDIEGLELVGSSDPGADEGSWSISGYATDEAVIQARDQGARVDVLLDAETRLAQLERVAEETRGSIPPGPAA
jgi:hypothetical protein